MPQQTMLGVFIVVAFISLPYLFLCCVVVLKSTSVETRLLGVGLLTAVAAIAYGSIVGMAGVQVTTGGLSAGVALGGLDASLMKIAVILVLGSIASGLWPRANG